MARLGTTTKLLSALKQHCQPLRQTSARMNFKSGNRLAPLVVRAMSTENQITNELIDRMRSKIQNALEAQQVEVADMQGDGRHVEIVVIAKAFEGQSAVNRQRMVYKAIWEELTDTVHAVDAMVTRTPEEAGLKE